MMRDGRNPYGSRGGYVRDSRDYDYRGNDFESRGMYDGRGDYDYDYEMEYPRDRHHRATMYPFEVRGRFGREPYYYDGRGSKELTEEDVKRWSKDLLEEVDDKDKQYFKMENIIKKAEGMGIRFDKFTPYEFYATVLMMLTDYCKTLGIGNPDIYLKLAKDWLMDEDVAVKGGEKLAAYYEYIVNAF